MKAVVYTKYGSPDVLQLKDVEKPAPLDDEVLVEVHAASVNAYDWHFLTADVFLIRLMGGGLLKPKKRTLGADIAGRVTAVGKNIRRLQPSDAQDAVTGCDIDVKDEMSSTFDQVKHQNAII